MNEKTHDLRGNMVDGWYWILLEEEFQKSATTFRSAGNNRAVEIAAPRTLGRSSRTSMIR